MTEDDTMRKKVKLIFLDFFMDGSRKFNGRDANEITLQEVHIFINEWVEKHFSESL